MRLFKFLTFLLFLYLLHKTYISYKGLKEEYRIENLKREDVMREIDNNCKMREADFYKKEQSDINENGN